MSFDIGLGFTSIPVLRTPSGFNPLVGNPVVWLDTSDEATLTGGGGGAITDYADKTANGYDASSPSGRQGIFTNDAYSAGLNGVLMDNTDDQIVWSGASGIQSEMATSATVILVFSADPSATFRVLLQKKNGSSYGHQFQNDSTDRGYLRIDTSAGVFTSSTAARNAMADAFDGNRHIVAWRINGSTGTVETFYDGSEVESTTFLVGTGLQASTFFTLFTACNGYFHEMLGFSSALSDDLFTQYTDYAIAKWSL